MGLLDRGRETVTIHPSVETGDGYGTKLRRPTGQPVTVERVLMIPRSAPESSERGQSARPEYRLLGRLPVIPGFDAFAEVTWQGRRFEVLGLPVRRDLIRRLSHTSALLREK